MGAVTSTTPAWKEAAEMHSSQDLLTQAPCEAQGRSWPPAGVASEQGLLHTTSRGNAVAQGYRQKSEVDTLAMSCKLELNQFSECVGSKCRNDRNTRCATKQNSTLSTIIPVHQSVCPHPTGTQKGQPWDTTSPTQQGCSAEGMGHEQPQKYITPVFKHNIFICG